MAEARKVKGQVICGYSLWENVQLTVKLKTDLTDFASANKMQAQRRETILTPPLKARCVVLQEQGLPAWPEGSGAGPSDRAHAMVFATGAF